jgi:group II intron reverse transcriptase/maturase
MIAQKAQHIPRDERERVRVLQRRLYSSAKVDPVRQYGVLYEKVYRLDVLHEAWRRVSRNDGCAGADQYSIQWIEQYGVDQYLQEIREQLRTQRYRPAPILRAYIEKPDGRQRPLGIPTVTDRVVQMAVKLVIEPLFEADFADCSYGFRPQRSAHDAIGQIDGCLRRGYAWVVDVDIEGYFDTIPHEPLLALVERRVSDPKLNRLIRRWLQASVLEDGERTPTERGTPQGGVLSPLLSNIYLHEIDRRWQARAPGARLVRYADDLLILCPTEADAQREAVLLRAEMGSMGLKLNEQKTRVVAAREGFDFLGFSYRLGQHGRGERRRETMVKVPRARAITGIQARVKEAVKRIPLGKTVAEVIAVVNRKLDGWANYFLPSNLEAALKRVLWHTTRELRIFLRRKYQRQRSQYSRRWPDGYFHAKLGLYTLSELVWRKAAGLIGTKEAEC